MFIGLQTRLIASLMGLFCCTLIVMGYVLLGDAKQRNHELYTSEARLLVKLLANGASESLIRKDSQLLERWVKSVVPDDKIAYAAVIDNDGKVIAHTHLSPDDKLISGLQSLGKKERASAENKSSKVQQFSFPVEVAGEQVANAYIGYYSGAAYDLTNKTVAKIITVVLVSLLVISLGSFYFTRKIINPIKYFTSVVSNVSYDRHIVVEKHVLARNDELGVLARTFSEMSGRLFDIYQKIREKNVELERRVEERTHKLVEANRDLKAAQQRIHAIVDNIAEGIITSDEFDRIISCNCAAEQIFEYPQEQLTGRTFRSLLDPSKCDCEKLQSGTGGHEYVAVRKNGEQFVLEVAVNTIYIASACTHIYVLHDISERKMLIDNLEHLADHDTDTGLYNKHHFEQEIEHIVERVRRGAIEQCALIYFHLYNFSEIEQQYGKEVSTGVLSDIAQLLQQRTRKSDELCHLEGNEFVLLTYGTNAQQADKVARDFMACITDYKLERQDAVIVVNCAIGVAMITKATASAEQVLTFADYACFKARKTGANRVHVFQYDIVDAEKVPDSKPAPAPTPTELTG